MIHTQVLIIGRGTSGMTAAKMACEAECSTNRVDRSCPTTKRIQNA
jgi:predicted flavoprotein YhiN